MKKIFGLLFLSIFLFACEEKTALTDFEVSLAKWQEFKTTSKNNYSYTVKTGSWASYGDSTIVYVTNGSVSGRKYASFTVDNQSGKKIAKEAWTETSADLNTHQNGAASMTLDAIYEKASKEWMIVDKTQNILHFETKNQGMISTCGYSAKTCQDDCFKGIYIINISITK